MGKHAPECRIFQDVGGFTGAGQGREFAPDIFCGVVYFWVCYIGEGGVGENASCGPPAPPCRPWVCDYIDA